MKKILGILGILLLLVLVPVSLAFQEQPRIKISTVYRDDIFKLNGFDINDAVVKLSANVKFYSKERAKLGLRFHVFGRDNNGDRISIQVKAPNRRATGIVDENNAEATTQKGTICVYREVYREGQKKKCLKNQEVTLDIDRVNNEARIITNEFIIEWINY